MERYSRGENIFNAFNITFFVLFCLATIYPFLNALAYSFSSAVGASAKIITIIPYQFNFDNYKVCLSRNDMPMAIFISISKTAIGTVLHLAVTGMAAYAISIKTLPFRKQITLFTIIPMYIISGLIPYYVTIHDVGLMNNFLVYIIPGAFAAYNMLIMRTYFDTLPESMVEYAKIDGAGEVRIFVSIIIPLSKPIIATIALFTGVSQWNSWFDAMLFVSNPKLHSLSMLLQRILISNEVTDARTAMAVSRLGTKVSPLGIKMAILIITTVPIVFIYPLFQRYFIKGIMIGAVKG